MLGTRRAVLDAEPALQLDRGCRAALEPAAIIASGFGAVLSGL